MCAAINGFRACYDSWPIRIRMAEGAIEYCSRKKRSQSQGENAHLFMTIHHTSQKMNWAEVTATGERGFPINHRIFRSASG